MTSLTHLATKCRFAVLEVSDDEDQEIAEVGDKAGSAKDADANNASKAKKKRKKKKTRVNNSQVVTVHFRIWPQVWIILWNPLDYVEMFVQKP